MANLTRYLYPFVYPFGPTKVAAFFAEYYGPTNRAYASLGDDARYALNEDLASLWTRNNLAVDGTTHIQAEYLVVDGTRA